MREHIAGRVDLRTTQVGDLAFFEARPRGSDRSVVRGRVAPLPERDRAGRGSTPVDSLLHDESEGTMSILQDPVRPLDPSSQQEFVERGREAEAERGGPEPLEEARGLAASRVQGQAPIPEAAMGWCEWECEPED